jgi:hypothetical protein
VLMVQLSSAGDDSSSSSGGIAPPPVLSLQEQMLIGGGGGGTSGSQLLSGAAVRVAVQALWSEFVGGAAAARRRPAEAFGSAEAAADLDCICVSSHRDVAVAVSRAGDILGWALQPASSGDEPRACVAGSVTTLLEAATAGTSWLSPRTQQHNAQDQNDHFVRLECKTFVLFMNHMLRCTC